MARLRQAYRDRANTGDGDEAAEAWLTWEHHWLTDRLREQTGPQGAAPAEAPLRFDVPEPLTQEQIGGMSENDVRKALVRIARVRRKSQFGDPVLYDRLCRQQEWLTERLFEIQRQRKTR